jgi:hypothetical protein
MLAEIPEVPHGPALQWALSTMFSDKFDLTYHKSMRQRNASFQNQIRMLHCIRPDRSRVVWKNQYPAAAAVKINDRIVE